MSDDELKNMIKAFDASIDIPEHELPEDFFDKDVSSAGLQSFKEKKHVSFPKWGFALCSAAAAVIVLISVLPYISSSSALTSDMAAGEESAMANEMYGFESMEEEAEIFYDESCEEDIQDNNDNSANSSSDGGAYENHEYDRIYDALKTYYEDGGKEYVIECPITDDIDVSLSRKRNAEIDISDDSVSVVMFDDSGEREILTAFWIEGKLISYGYSSTLLSLEIDYPVSYDSLDETENFLPEISDENGIYTLGAENISYSGTVTEPVIHLTVFVSADDGNYYVEGYVS